MTKLKAILKFVVIAAAAIAGLIYLNSQNSETQMLVGVCGLILYLAYLGNQRIDELKKEKFYHCTFEKEIIAADSDEAIARLKVEYKLPFPPYIGLQVSGHLNPAPEDCDDYENHDFQSFYTDKIIDVVFYYSSFNCKVEPYKMKADDKIEEVIIAYSEGAWKPDAMSLILDRGRALFTFIDEHLIKLEKLDDDASKKQYLRFERVKKKLGR
ncbi:MAG: hypothetical protein ACOYJ2_01990 [Rickettsiales bacterium]